VSPSVEAEEKTSDAKLKDSVLRSNFLRGFQISESFAVSKNVTKLDPLPSLPDLQTDPSRTPER
jgi:hypothetical protein